MHYLFRDDGGREWGNNDQYTYNNSTYLIGNGTVQSGWKTYKHNNKDMVSYFWPDTLKMAQGLVTIDGQRYLFRDDGGREWGNADQYVYHDKIYFVSQGKVETGWQTYMHKNVKTVSYFDPDTAEMAVGFKTIDGKSYLFREDGSREWGNNGRYVYKNNTYYIDNGEVKTGWLTYQYNGKSMVSYFWPQTGIMAIGFNIIDEDGYLFRDDGGREWGNNGLYTYKGKTYYIDNGKAKTGWLYCQINGKREQAYFWPSTGVMLTGPNWVVGEYCFFTSDGARVWDGLRQYGSKYYFVKDGLILRNQMVTVNGKTYQADASGVLQGYSELKGIDVSSNNGVIDWAKVKADGIDFVIIRAMHWSNASNSYVMDTMFVQNVYGAKSAGLLVGAYWFSEAFNGTEAAQEVQFIANSAEWKNLKQAGVVLDMPFYIDYEDYNWLNQHTTYESRTEAVRTGMDCAEQMLGTQSGFYTSDNYAQSWFNGQQLINEGYNAWIARWSSTAPQMSGYVMWQYSNSGTVNGINGRVDLNYSYESYTFHPVTNYTGNYTTITVYDENSKGDITKNITEIVKQIVANEVGSGLGLTGMDRTELYKAQAVAAHSYLVSVLNAGGKPSVGLKDYSSFAGLSDAVEAVKNQMLIYNGSVINAVYTSCSGSHTNSAANMGWTAQPYLTSVESKYDSQMSGAAGYYHRNSTITLETMRSNVIKMVGSTYNAYANDPSKWISEIHTDAHGNIDYAIVCGVKVSGGKFYDNCYGLYGPNIDSWKFNGSSWTFVSNGNGHGVGMSQYGAAGYIAKEGWNYKQILEHYYNGAKVVG